MHKLLVMNALQSKATSDLNSKAKELHNLDK